VMGQLIRHGRVRRASIGIAAQHAFVPRRVQISTGVEQASGAMIAAVETDGPADQAGLLIGDTVVALDGRPVTGVDDLVRHLNEERIGRTTTIDLLRNGRARAFEVTPRER
jgi:S1-C subfamily serine protease